MSERGTNLTDEYPMLIGSEWSRGSLSKTFTVLDPSTNKPLTRVYEAGVEDVGAVVDAAKQGFRTSKWAREGAERGRLIFKLVQLMTETFDRLATIETLQVGKPIREARTETNSAIRHFEYFAGLADKIEGSTLPFMQNKFVYTLREPYGVIAQIVPWNSPLLLMARGVAPALACGNTVVIKPSVHAPLSILEFAKLTEKAGFPPGVVNVLVGPGETVGAELAGHRDVKKIVFTGSVSGGKRIMEIAARNITPTLLELGGKAPFMILEDVDMGEALDGAMAASFLGQGEVCFAGTRLLVPNSWYDKFVNELAGRVNRIRVGIGLEEKTEMGPLITSEHLKRVMGYVELAKEEGARVISGGKQPDDPKLKDGNFMLPTLLKDVTPDMRVAQEEIFGPALSILRYNDTEAMIETANSVYFGLSAFVWTNDLRKALRIASRLEAGSISVFSYGYGPEVPRGGYKMSGIGREAGLNSINEYTQLKNVSIGFDRFPTMYGA